MGFLTILTSIASFALPIIKKIGSAVCKAGSYGLSKASEALASNALPAGITSQISGGTVTHERAEFNAITDIELEKQEETLATVTDFYKMGVPLDMAQKLTEKIYGCCDQSKTITQTPIIQLEQLSTSMNFTMENKDANYIPISAFTFKKSIVESLSKYDYIVPLLLISEMKNVTDNTGIRLDVAITTAYESAWTKIKPENLLKNLNPSTIDNKQSLIDFQPMSFEDYETVTVGELQKKYKWLTKGENLDILYKNDFTEEEIKEKGRDETTRNPNNLVVIKSGIRKDTQWIPYSVFRTKLNGMKNGDGFSNTCTLFTGYCVKPRLEDDSNENTKCKVSITVNMIVLGLQNGADLAGNMLRYPSGIEVTVPGHDGATHITSPKEIQAYAAECYLTQLEARPYPCTLIKKEMLDIYETWYNKIQNKNIGKSEVERFEGLLKTGICLHAQGDNDCGITIFE